ncbi:phosphoserine aminotransferase [Angustibacter aerolatus]|uniref:Phosphoserine aminotransferase n=1 Tax=Angustibacter aerolatus TaxID=1162965 RepID=A0ABQ6JEZ3_9ACTN|nr:phosphoserine aminotransferase [Angustibacter aerolatus]
MLGNGGSTTFWDVATLGLVRDRAQHLVLGEFSAKFAQATAAAPFLAEPHVVRSEPGTRPDPVADPDVDVHAWPHNETSTGVVLPVQRVAGTAAPDDGGPLVLVDATSAAAGVDVDLAQCDAYYLAPQKGFASDGGLWFALLSPAAIERAREPGGSGRWVPESLSLTTAIDNSRLDQTYNTPAIATLLMMAAQARLAAGQRRPVVGRRAHRRLGVAAVRLGRPQRLRHAVRRRPDAPLTRRRHHRPRRLDRRRRGREAPAAQRDRRHRALPQGSAATSLRVGMFPAVDPSDVEALTACVDHVVAHLPRRR